MPTNQISSKPTTPPHRRPGRRRRRQPQWGRTGTSRRSSGGGGVGGTVGSAGVLIFCQAAVRIWVQGRRAGRCSQVSRGPWAIRAGISRITTAGFGSRPHGSGSGRVPTGLLSRVWGYDFDPGSNVVDGYIRYLRRKGRQHPDRDHPCGGLPPVPAQPRRRPRDRGRTRRSTRRPMSPSLAAQPGVCACIRGSLTVLFDGAEPQRVEDRDPRCRSLRRPDPRSSSWPICRRLPVR
jgi:hypothetical protein